MDYPYTCNFFLDQSFQVSLKITVALAKILTPLLNVIAIQITYIHLRPSQWTWFKKFKKKKQARIFVLKISLYWKEQWFVHNVQILIILLIGYNIALVFLSSFSKSLMLLLTGML